MTPGPGHRKCTPYLWPGPGGMPLGLRLSEVLGSAGGMPRRAGVPPLMSCMVARTSDEQIGLFLMDSGALTSGVWFEIAEVAAYWLLQTFPRAATRPWRLKLLAHRRALPAVLARSYSTPASCSAEVFPCNDVSRIMASWRFHFRCRQGCNTALRLAFTRREARLSFCAA